MLSTALELIKLYGIKLDNPYNRVSLGEKTEVIDHELFIKNIPDGLLFLMNQMEGKTKPNNPFKHTSTMIDLSRNQVFQVSYFKEVILKHALLGYDEIWLYMEDTYEIKEVPKFGYMRGRYTEKELNELVLFAEKLGVTLIPCIQTLGHLKSFLRWFSHKKYKDTVDVLKVGSNDVYDLIDLMVKTMRRIFKTEKIHVGMDETFGLGFGNFYKENGFVPQKEIFMNHLIKVNEICLNHGYKDVYIWSDMFFRMGSKTESYYDLNIILDKEYMDRVPKNVGLVYWDYYNSNPELVTAMVQKHLDTNRKVIFASGTWMWTKLTYDKKKTDSTALVHIDVSLKLGIEEICFTQWQDDGAYCEYDSIYLGLYDVQNHIHQNQLNQSIYTKVTKHDYDKRVLVADFNNLGIIPINLLWDDLILGIYMNDCFGYDYKLIDPVIEAFDNYLNKLDENQIEGYVYQLAQLLRLKLKIRRDLLDYYQNKQPLKPLETLLTEFKEKNDSLINTLRINWLSQNKIYGLEVLESRLEVFRSRVTDLLILIKLYDKKEIKALDFLEFELTKEPYLSPKFTDTFYGTSVF
jgi:hypothetical protein